MNIPLKYCAIGFVIVAVALVTFNVGKTAGREQSQTDSLRADVSQNSRDIDTLRSDVDELKAWRQHFGRSGQTGAAR